MAIIYSFPQISELAPGDTIAISDASNGNKTKSVTIGQLDSYINTGQATTTYVDDRVVSGASFNTDTGVLTLTRTDGIDVTTDLDGRYALSSDVFSGDYDDLSNKPTIPAAYTNADVDAHLNTSTATASQVLSWTGNDYTWVAQSSGGGGSVTEITTTGPITGGTITTTGTIGITKASTSTDGYLDSTDWNTFNNKSSFDGQYSSLTGAPTLAAVATSGNYNDLLNQPTIPTDNSQLANGAGYTTNLGIVQSLTTTGSSGAATLSNGVLNIPQYSSGGSGDTYDLNAGTKSGNSVPLNLTSGSGTDNSAVNLTEGSNITLTQTSSTEITIASTGGSSGVTSIIAGTGIGIDQSTGDVTITNTGSATGSYATLTRTFTGSELVNAFNGILGEEIVLVTVPAGYQALILGDAIAYVDYNTGTTNYTGPNLNLRIDNTAQFISLDSTMFSNSLYPCYITNGQTDSNNSLSTSSLGENIVLKSFSSVQKANFTAGDRDFTISFTYRLINLNL
jgi:hypothetical protein